MKQSVIGRYWPAIATSLAILSLWPMILGWKHPAWDYLMYGMLLVMLVLAVVNVHRLWETRYSDHKEEL